MPVIRTMLIAIREKNTNASLKANFDVEIIRRVQYLIPLKVIKIGHLKQLMEVEISSSKGPGNSSEMTFLRDAL